MLNSDDTSNAVSVAGFFISPRHVLTSAFSILTGARNWRINYNKEQVFKTLEYIKDTLFVFYLKIVCDKLQQDLLETGVAYRSKMCSN